MWPFSKRKSKGEKKKAKEKKKKDFSTKVKGRFKEEYKGFVKRKEMERKEGAPKLHEIPSVEEIQKHAKPKAKLNHLDKKVITKKKRIKRKLAGVKEKVKRKREWLKIGVPGFDDLLEKGIPKGAAILVAGGCGSGKTIFCLQTLNYGASAHKEKCLYISFEESEERLKEHMKDFGWEPKELEKKGLLVIKRCDPFDISTSVEALLAKAKGELLIDLEEVPGLIPEGFKPDRVVLDSISALAAAFVKHEESYRIYIEQLFRYFEKIGTTSFLITETEQVPTRFSETGVEEFLADGVIVIYNIRRGNIRERAIEMLKLRGAKHQKKVVAFQITNEGMVVYPEQEVFGGLEETK